MDGQKLKFNQSIRKREKVKLIVIIFLDKQA